MATSHLPDREWKSRLKASGACEMYVEESREVEGSRGVERHSESAFVVRLETERDTKDSHF
jgi:hypothetical protein